MKQRLPFLVVLGALVALTGCGSDTPSPSTPDGGSTDGGSTPDGGSEDVVVLPDHELTWYRDVLPIVQARCQECHVAGGIAPFALTTYADAKAMHTSMANAAVNRRMPPWMPDNTCVSYVGSRRLSATEIAILATWSEKGALEGNPADAPPPPQGLGTLPWVDATLNTGADYTPTSVPTDDYRCFMLDPGLTQDRDLIGYDITPGVRNQVHHVILYATTKANAQRKDDSEPGLGWTCFGGPGTSSSRMLGGWVPGSGATRFPEGTGIQIKAGEVLVMQIHYNTSQRVSQADRTSAKLQYSAQPVPALASFVELVNGTFAIPPQSTDYSATASIVVPNNAVRVYGVLPHMHTLGKSIRVENRTTGQCFVNIPRWDFHWQQIYFFTEPIRPGTLSKVVLTCTWDNYTDRTVRWGESTTDEMCINYFYVTSQ
ncbi:MAG TPA: hypothetical protein VNA24_04525 [Hyalangium sp.]|nr:hypothetical protein [Hyalangium sp.]